MVTTGRCVALISSDPARTLPPSDSTCPFFVERIDWASGDPLRSAVRLVERVVAAGALALCIAEDVPKDLALEISRLIDERSPEIGVLLLREPDGDLWGEAARAGVRDIIRRTSESVDLLPAIHLALDRGERLHAGHSTEPSQPTGKVIVVLSPKGGSGKTMVASNLAVALAASNTGDTVLVDLDCVFGDVASVLGMVPEQTVGQLASLGSFDSTTLKVFLTRHERTGLFVLAGSGSPEEGEAVTDKMTHQILDLLARDFAYVVVDTAAGLDERALAAADLATDLVLLASMDVASVRNLAKEINALDRLNLTPARRHFILNRADTRVGLEVGDVESAIGMTVDAALPSSRAVPLSMNQGTTVVLDERDSPVAQQLLSFAARFLPATPRPETPNADRKARFSLRRR